MKKSIALTSLVLSLVFIAPALVSAATTPTTNTDAGSKIACIGSAVATREAAIASDFSTYTKAISDAYSARSTALAQAYTGSDAKSVKTAAKAAWSTFSASKKTAAAAWKTARNADWASFKTAAKACKAPATVNDSANASLEASGQ